MAFVVLQSVDSPRREIDWRLAVAAELYKVGISSVIASKTQIELVHSIVDSPIYFGRLNGVTGRSQSDLDFLSKALNNNTAIFFLHDEGGFYFKNEYDHAVRKIYPNELFELSIFKKVYFWGERQLRVLSQSSAADKFSVSGNPRFELLKKKYEFFDKEWLKSTSRDIGEYILICTRFGAVNRVPDEPGTLSKRSFEIREEGGALKYTNREGILSTMFEAWSKIGHEFAEFIPAIASLAHTHPEVKFVIRPHPAEKESFYSEAFSHFDNVIVTKSGDARAWIKGAKCVIHSECTTGLESVIAGVPTINFTPVDSEFSVACVSDVGIKVDTCEALHQKVKSILSRDVEASNPPINESIIDYVNNAGDFDAIATIVKDIQNFTCETTSDRKGIAYRKLLNLSLLKGVIYELGRLAYHKLRYRKLSGGDLKYYRYSKDEIRTKWKLLTGSDDGIKVISNAIFITAKK